LLRSHLLPRWLLLSLVLACIVGCVDAEPDEPLPDFNSVPLVPAGGLVTLDGKPLAHAVVSFMPKHGPIATGETDENGHYTLSYGREGAPVGTYIVAVSYLISAEGEPQGLASRSGLSLPPSMRTAQERLPKEYSDLGRSKLRGTVPAGGSTALDFDLTGPLLPGPESARPESPDAQAPAPTKPENPATQPPGDTTEPKEPKVP
jgi:hypothetical protein